MNSMKLIIFLCIVGAIFTAINVYILLGISEPKAVIAQPECPKGLAKSAAQKKYDYDQSAFQAMRKGPR